jgi:hypothetical protein
MLVGRFWAISHFCTGERLVLNSAANTAWLTRVVWRMRSNLRRSQRRNRLQGKRIELAHRHLIDSASGMEAFVRGQDSQEWVISSYTSHSTSIDSKPP